jgi:hypothetical protein
MMRVDLEESAERPDRLVELLLAKEREPPAVVLDSGIGHRGSWGGLFLDEGGKIWDVRGRREALAFEELQYLLLAIVGAYGNGLGEPGRILRAGASASFLVWLRRARGAELVKLGTRERELSAERSKLFGLLLDLGVKRGHLSFGREVGRMSCT